MAPPPERNHAPYCDHAYTVVNVRGGYQIALETVENLRATHDGDYYVSDPFNLSGAWVFALCPGCRRPPPRPAPVLDRRRAEKTTLKTRHGGLPAATREQPETSAGDGTRCDGCGEPIQPAERMSKLDVYGVLLVRFHDACYAAWVRFQP